MEIPTITLLPFESMLSSPSACLDRIVLVVLVAATLSGVHAAEPVAPSLVETIANTQPKIVKIYGAGGLRGLEAYQSGLLISAEGHILTAWSTVLDTDSITVVLSDGRKFGARLLGADPQVEVAVLRIDGRDLPHFDLNQAVEADAGTGVLAFSNLFNVAVGDEPASVQRGTIAVKTRLEARRGVFETPYTGPVYVLDVVTSNPGSAGGALVTRRGELVGMLGKELRNALNHTWLNYATPISSLRPSVEAICSGKSVVRKPDDRKKPARGLTPAMLGLVLVPDVVERTPPYVDGVLPGSPADKAGIRPDDLIVLVGDQLVPSCKALRKELEYIDHEDKVNVTVLRLQEMLEFTLQAGRDDK
ncbi:MAG: S1C family serine protease [Thermoguttaceae bacterium]|nr:S1C family serine protease [Thermoguttaceae bacterium]